MFSHLSVLQGPRDFLYFKDFELIAFLDVIEILQGEAAFKAGFDFFDYIFESLK